MFHAKPLKIMQESIGDVDCEILGNLVWFLRAFGRSGKMNDLMTTASAYQYSPIQNNALVKVSW